MKMVLMAMFILGMSATAHAAIVLDTGRRGAEAIKATGMQITNGSVVVQTPKGTITFTQKSLKTAGISPVEMVGLVNKFNISVEVLKITGSSYIQYNTVNVDTFALQF